MSRIFRCCVEGNREKEDLIENGRMVMATDPQSAAERYAESNMSDFDWLTEIRVWVVLDGGTAGEITTWDVTIESVPDATARLAR